jgi:hypothetical protein
MDDSEREQGESDFAARQREKADFHSGPPDSDEHGILHLGHGRRVDLADHQGPVTKWKRALPHPTRARNR